MKIRYKASAIVDIQRTERYIEVELHNKTAAKKLTRMIFQAISLLADNPYMGTALNARFEVDTDIRFLAVSKQLVFYRMVDEENVEVTRVLDGQQDYLSKLF